MAVFVMKSPNLIYASVVLSYRDDGLTFTKFSKEKTLKRVVVIFAAISQ
jgi:hypothetical protein